jgi:glutathione synthetase
MRVLAEGIKQPIELGLHRSDYMVHYAGENRYLQQVELNTIAASFSSLSTFVSQLHKYLVTRFNLTEHYPLSSLPPNGAQFAIPKGIATAFKLYNSPKAVVVMIVQKEEKNLWDQRWIEYHLWESYGIPLIRYSLCEVEDKGRIDTNTFNLIIDEKEVAVVYFRAGYVPKDYPSQKEWDGRLLIERSRAIKCPSISYHILGAKKVQQVISTPGVLERLIPDQESVKRMQASFTGLYSIAGSQSEEIVQKAIKNPFDFVMKPQREGGGNNLYKEDLQRALQTMTTDERAAWILMDRIKSLPVLTHILRDSNVSPVNAVSELGIFGVFVSDGEKVVLNEAGGLLLRTKGAAIEDGGVAAGVAVLDSPLLV